MYTKAFYKGMDDQGGKIRLIVVFTGVNETDWVENYYPSGSINSTWLIDQARNTLNGLNSRQLVLKALTPGELDLTATATTPEDQHLIDLANKKLEVATAKFELDLTLITQTEFDQKVTEYKSLKSK